MSRMQKISILSISLLAIMSSATISPVLSTIGDYFSDASDLMVKMVVSLPAIFIIPVTLITGKLIFYIKKKHLLYAGLILYLIGGLGGGLANSIEVLLMFRAIMGIGVGLLTPLTRGVIADFFKDRELVKMMGYSTATNNLGAIIATASAGLLSVLGWRYPFLVYGVAFVVLFLVVFFMPDSEIPLKQEGKTTITKNVWLIGLSHFYTIIIFFAIPSGLSFYIVQKGLGTDALTGILISLITVSSFLFGLVFLQIKEYLKENIVLVGLAMMTLGMLGIAVSNTIFLIAVSLFVVGMGLGVIAPNIYLHTSLESSKSDVTLSLAIVSCFSFLGQFTSPLINELIQNIFNYHDLASTFYISVGFGVLGIILLILNRYLKIYVPTTKR